MRTLNWATLNVSQKIPYAKLKKGRHKLEEIFIIGHSINIPDGDCSHEIKRHFLLGRKVLTNLSQFSSVAQSCPTLCDPMNHNMPGLLVHHQLPEFTQTHIHQVVDAIQPSHPLSSPSPPAPNPSQHQSFPMSLLFA